MAPRFQERDGDIVAATMRLLETEGYDAVQVRRVAAEASISLATLYKLYGSRDELIVTALERWMAERAYVVEGILDDAVEPVEAVVAIVRNVYAPMERQPRIFEAIIRARMHPSGRRLDIQGIGLLLPQVRRILAGYDPAVISDLEVILEHVNLGTAARFATGEIAVTDISPILERTIRRVLAATKPSRLKESPASRARRRSGSTTNARNR